MNVVLLVVDSLRARSLVGAQAGDPCVPFLRQLDRETICFRRAYATECWTLPTHCSMFTGLLPSAHGAHFHTMGYTGEAPTIAELLAAAGYQTEVVTRNFVFDGTIPGVTRGFAARTQLLSELGALNPWALLLAIAKPRFRRHVRATGFFHPLQRDNRRFLATFARAMMPADGRSLAYVLERMTAYRRAGRRYFIFTNLYDVHAPYPPTPTSILRSFRSLPGVVENLMFPSVMSRLGAHMYLLPNFRISAAGRRMLRNRYHRAVELMDAKLREFCETARGNGLLDDTLLIVTSDHGEAFGEHGLYLHDASVYDTHLHVPLWVRHPGRAAEVVDDVVSTRDLFGLMRAAAFGEGVAHTIVDPAYRARQPIALAEHFHYRHAGGMLPRYRQNIAAAIGASCKVIKRREGVFAYDLASDPDEARPQPGAVAEVAAAWRGAGMPAPAVDAAAQHLTAWCPDTAPA
jgi:hypothetical protein